ncbi:hypothetical protein [Lacticaseibacillus sp. 866-1]|uniref:hypothetical protein n=1 Tax=Lacticaseibacillus sp. 866-1 TaxID=2799576 RepID=UPI0019407C94|nr:hypothetical protein [Lacticaseibacillus sp. 866-1]
MTMIKLDNEDYINTTWITQLVKLVDGTWQAWLGDDTVTITEADRDRIVEAINGKPYKPMTRQLKRALNSAAGGEA